MTKSWPKTNRPTYFTEIYALEYNADENCNIENSYFSVKYGIYH